MAIRSFWLAAAAVAVALTGAPHANAQDDTIKIGAIWPTKTLNGKQGVQGAQLAIDLVNADGGVNGRQLELVAYDTNLQPTDGVAAVQRLIDQDGVKIVTGELSSSVALAVVPVIQASDALYIAAVPKHPDVTKAENDRVFRLNSTTAMDSAFFDSYLSSRYPDGKIAFLAENNDFGKLWTDHFKQLYGDRLVFSELFGMTQSNFISMVSNLKASGADLVCIASSNVEQWGNILRNMSEAAYTPSQRCIMPGQMNSDGIRIAGDAAEGVFSADIYTSSIESDFNRRFVDAYREKFGNNPEKVEALAFQAVWIAAEAARKVGNADDVEALAEAIRSATWDGPVGSISFDEAGQASVGELFPMEVRDGRIGVITSN